MIAIELIKEGVTIRTADLRKRVVARKDGKYVYFEDGSKFRLHHPDLVEIVEEEEAPKPKKSRKKKAEENEAE